MTDFSDQYGYGQPMPPPPPSSRPTGKQILTACWTMLRQDRSLLALPVISALAGLVAATVLFVPAWAIGKAVSSMHTGVEAGLVAAVFAASVVGIFFQAALVIGANERADGRVPTLGGVLRQALTLVRPVLAWALVTTTVGMAIRFAEQRLGAIGKLAGFLSGLAWAIATFLAVPVVVAEGLGPVAAVRRSAELIRATWGTSLRTTVRFGLLGLLLTVPGIILAVAGVALLLSGSPAGVAAGVLLLAVAFVAVLAVSAVFSAISSYARAMIYRYATGRPVPGIPAEAFAGAFVPKRRRR